MGRTTLVARIFYLVIVFPYFDSNVSGIIDIGIRLLKNIPTVIYIIESVAPTGTFISLSFFKSLFFFDVVPSVFAFLPSLFFSFVFFSFE